jgi:hypothetical protein
VHSSLTADANSLTETVTCSDIRVYMVRQLQVPSATFDIHDLFPSMIFISFDGDFKGLYNYADLRLCAPFYRTSEHATPVLELRGEKERYDGLIWPLYFGAVPCPDLTEHGICGNRWCKYA